jgi:fatty acid desaturase
MSVGPLGQASRGPRLEVPEDPDRFTMSRPAMAIIIMWVAALLAGVGAGTQWGWGSGLFTFGIMIGVYGVLLGLG